MPARLERRLRILSAAVSTSKVMMSVETAGSDFRNCMGWISQLLMVFTALCDIGSMSPYDRYFREVDKTISWKLTFCLNTASHNFSGFAIARSVVLAIAEAALRSFRA